MLGLLIRCVLLIGTKIIEGFTLMTSTVYYFQNIKRCPAIKDDIIFYPAYVLADKIRKRELSCETVVRAYINRIKEVNPILNAIVEDRFESAIIEAIQTDKMLAATNMTMDELKHQYPLLGIPITVKESIAVEGMSHCAGKIFSNIKIASKDAEIVQLCREAGAIPVAVTNTPELCINFETYNKIVGKTCNPYDSRRSPGGSSGGEAALLGSGASVIGLGSDIYGSVRLPAHYCGVWGHKPSTNIVSVDGHYPDCKHEKEWNDVFNLGPMCRYATDLQLSMSVLLKSSYTSLIQLNAPVHLPSLKVFYMENNNGSILTHPVDKDILNALRRLVAHMASKYGCKVQQLQMKEFKYSAELSLIKLCNMEDIEPVFDNNGEGSYGELLRYLTFRSKSVLIPIACGIIKNKWSYMPKSVIRHFSEIEAQFRTTLCQTLGNDGILIYPCHTTTAPLHGRSLGRIFDYSYVGIFNCLGLPVTNCPLGLSSNGLPIGIQVAAAPNNDRLTLAVAREIEAAFGGWIPPPFKTT